MYYINIENHCVLTIKKSFVKSIADDLVDLVIQRHEKELTQDKKLISIDDRINADFNQSKSELKNL